MYSNCTYKLHVNEIMNNYDGWIRTTEATHTQSKTVQVLHHDMKPMTMCHTLYRIGQYWYLPYVSSKYSNYCIWVCIYELIVTSQTECKLKLIVDLACFFSG